MITIHKFRLMFLPGSERAITSVSMPEDAEVLYFGVQRDAFCVWARVDTEKPTQERTFEVLGTGHKICDNLDDYCNEYAYVNTAFSHEGEFVWHLFERP